MMVRGRRFRSSSRTRRSIRTFSRMVSSLAFTRSRSTVAGRKPSTEKPCVVISACRAVNRLMKPRVSGPTLAPAVPDGQAKAWPRSGSGAARDGSDPGARLRPCLAGTQGVRHPLQARLTPAGQARTSGSERGERREERVDLGVRADGDAERVLEPGLRKVADEDVARRERAGHGPLIDPRTPREDEVSLRGQHAKAELLQPRGEPRPRRPDACDVRPHGRQVAER